jgi:[acyl-carrier-protein] S-malonyltransferase
MGRDLADAFPAARQVFEEVDDALSERLSRRIFEGPEDELTLTENAQPALMATSLAVLRAIEEEGKVRLPALASFVAGHSLGEYSALAAAGSLSVSDTARLLRRRGQAMQKAVPVGEGAMAALIGADLDAACAIAKDATEAGVCAVANDNAPGQVVVSGAKVAVERAVALADERGIRRAVMLPVSAPFHCPLMAPAAELMAEALEAVAFHPPSVPLVANVTAQPEDQPERLRDLLVEQVTAMVRWRETVQFFVQAEVEGLVELGAGQVLSGLARRIDRDLVATPIAMPGDIEAFLETL